ncbi:MAG: ATP synthase F0 subunit B [Deltaproteobacteria bacterium]|nr:ATP synthase F0 subunit B [Deltaproteobacteria bacterium]
MVDISINWSTPIQIINFLILMLILNAIVYKPLRKILSERNTFFETLRQQADTAKMMIEEGESKQTQQHNEVIGLGSDMLRRFTDEGRSREQELLAETQRESVRRVEEARSRLAQAVTDTRTQLRQEANVLARSLAEKILGRSLAD